jgi:hypothetical protein
MKVAGVDKQEPEAKPIILALSPKTAIMLMSQQNAKGNESSAERA